MNDEPTKTAEEIAFAAGFNAGRQGDRYYGPAWLVYRSKVARKVSRQMNMERSHD